MSRLRERRLSGKAVYRGSFFTVYRDRVRLPDGRKAQREYLRHPGAVAIVALDSRGRVVLERQHRYPHGRDFIEIPAGKIDRGERPLVCAKRELLEETGYVARRWRRLGVIHNAIGYSDEAIELWLATGLEKKEAKLDAGEFLEAFLLDFRTALRRIDSGAITDAKSICGLLLAKKRPR